MMNVELRCQFHFEAAHRNMSAPSQARVARLHGHSYTVAVTVAGPVDDARGWLVDFADIRSAGAPIVGQLDHRLLNDIKGMGDTSRENVEHWLAKRLAETMPGFVGCSVTIIGDTSFDPLLTRVGTPDQRRELLRFGFAAAHHLPQSPSAHKCRRLHGHSFRCLIDTRDSPPVIARLAVLYDQLDHRLLNDVPGLENPTSEHLAHWLWHQLEGCRTTIASVTIQETCTAACTYRGD